MREAEVQGSEKNYISERNRREGTGMQKRGDTAPRVQDSRQLPLSEVLGEFDSSGASVSLSLPLLSSSVAPVT